MILKTLKTCPDNSSCSPILGEKIPIYLGSWWRRARMGNAIIFPSRRAMTVCLTVITPASINAPAAANPEVNSAAKLNITTDSDSTGIIERVTNCDKTLLR